MLALMYSSDNSTDGRSIRRSSKTLPAVLTCWSGYAGPINIRFSAGRGAKSRKGYICVFVCFATRAVHLEAASDYSTREFIDVYRRFVGRRGICATLYGDCGTNFVGASFELKKLLLEAGSSSSDIARLLARDGTECRFSPPSAPHCGGLWEAAVKSVKYHLKRVIGESTLTFEEMSALLVQVEACLNSRPLCPLNDDVSNHSLLTPAHFLIGEPFKLVPEPSVFSIPDNRLARW
ncbi:uncharacterized protein LOC107226152 [Neodiprion lecontei]|uniref:Uncharacterized protein LOC107226152 n=1 Tax=Neodiprion lecontei TaxID=441921 RepID=A0A6J0C4W5_NEOLC|nr:uncharacterized protein LOC107226152 [Neodiprion lecontei]